MATALAIPDVTSTTKRWVPVTEQDKLPPVPLADALDRFIQRIGLTIGWVFVLLVAVIILQIVLRKGFASGLIVLEELQWHLYATGVMFGLSYAQTTNSHIRVDLFYTSFRAKTKRIIEVIGIFEQQFKKGKSLTIVKPGTQRRDFFDWVVAVGCFLQNSQVCENL